MTRKTILSGVFFALPALSQGTRRRPALGLLLIAGLFAGCTGDSGLPATFDELHFAAYSPSGDLLAVSGSRSGESRTLVVRRDDGTTACSIAGRALRWGYSDDYLRIRRADGLLVIDAARGCRATELRFPSLDCPSQDAQRVTSRRILAMYPDAFVIGCVAQQQSLKPRAQTLASLRLCPGQSQGMPACRSLQPPPCVDLYDVSVQRDHGDSAIHAVIGRCTDLETLPPRHLAVRWDLVRHSVQTHDLGSIVSPTLAIPGVADGLRAIRANPDGRTYTAWSLLRPAPARRGTVDANLWLDAPHLVDSPPTAIGCIETATHSHSAFTTLDADGAGAVLLHSSAGGRSQVLHLETGEDCGRPMELAHISRDLPVEVTTTTGDDATVRAFLSTPMKLPARGMVVRIHGGPFSSERRQTDTVDRAWASAGYFVLRPNYLGATSAYAHAAQPSSGARFSAMVDEILRVLDQTAEEIALDPLPIIVQGDSFGGLLALAVAERIEQARALVLWSPLCDAQLAIDRADRLSRELAAPALSSFVPADLLATLGPAGCRTGDFPAETFIVFSASDPALGAETIDAIRALALQDEGPMLLEVPGGPFHVGKYDSRSPEVVRRIANAIGD